MATANVAEVFSGVQGEGMLVGERQLFVRFSGCNLRCAYCDTKWAWEERGDCRVEKRPGSASFIFVRNPLDAPRLGSILADLRGDKDLHHSLCLTGGEPLMQEEFLVEFLPGLGSLFPMTYLETNGLLPERLSRVIDLVDIISMDIKLASVTRARADFEAHRKFLLAAARRKVFVKVVVCSQTTVEEIGEAVSVVTSVDREIPMVIQPVVGLEVGGPPVAQQLLRFQTQAKQDLATVRVIPQTHKMLGLL